MSSIDDDPELQARILEAIQQVNKEYALTKMYLFPWEDESLRESYQLIELYVDISKSDEYNYLFTPKPLNVTNFWRR